MLAHLLRTSVALMVAAGCLVAGPAGALAQINSIPSPAHYAGVQNLYQGEYRNALRSFTREVRTGGVKIGVQTRWIDSICYHAMLGETLYHYGRPADALEQFDLALSLYLQNPKWLLRVNFDQSPPRPATNIGRRPIPWGGSQRPAALAQFTDTMLVQMVRLDNRDTVRTGGVVQQAQYWKVDVVEIIRCTALAMRRRNELLGPLGKYNDLSKDLVAELIRPGTPPNHWSNAWLELLRGIAHVGVGEEERARQFLDRGLLLMGQYDHPLTCIALLEQGQLAMSDGNGVEADRLFAEASYSAFYYEDVNAIDEAFRLAEVNRLANGVDSLNPGLEPAAAWARQKRFDHVYARLSLATCEELLELGNLSAASAALQAAQTRLGEARAGLLGVLAANLEAQIDFHLRRDSGPAKLAAAVEMQQNVSFWNFQIGLANAMFDSQALPASDAGQVYQKLLMNPSAADVALRLRDVLAVLKTPHDDAFSRWMVALLERRDLAGALEVSDRAKQRRYFIAMPWGGRLTALRDLATTPVNHLSLANRQLQAALLARFPALEDAVAAEHEARARIDKSWQRGLDEDEQSQIGRSWRDYADAVAMREALLKQISLQRVPAEMSFPPLMTADQLQSRLRPGEAVLVFHDTPSALYGFLFTSNASIAWDCGPSNLLQRRRIEPLLRELGNYDANRELTAEQLASTDWHKLARDLYEALLGNASLDPTPLTDLVIVPDGPVWYVPFEALMVKTETDLKPLHSFTRIRYAPTIGLAFSNEGPLRRVQRTGVVAGDMVPGESDEARQAAVQSLDAALERTFPLTAPLPTDSPLTASLIDQLVVLADVETEGFGPLDLSPLPLDRSDAAGSLLAWTRLGRTGPQRIYLPGMRTVAEHGGRAGRRRGGGAIPGAELFLTSCSLMASGAETMLLSRWRVGGQTSLELVQELAMELPHAAAGEAWARALDIVRTTPIDPLSEPRVKEAEEQTELTAAHPFFWAGYLVVDSGWAPEPEEEADGVQPAGQAGQQAAAPGDAAQPANAGQAQPAGQVVPAGAEPRVELEAVSDAIGIPNPAEEPSGE